MKKRIILVAIVGLCLLLLPQMISTANAASYRIRFYLDKSNHIVCQYYFNPYSAGTPRWILKETPQFLSLNGTTYEITNDGYVKGNGKSQLIYFDENENNLFDGSNYSQPNYKGTYYYINENNQFVTGWQQIDDSMYYFKYNHMNNMLITGPIAIDGVTYLIGENGEMLTNTWYSNSNGSGKYLFYFGNDGKKVIREGFWEIDGKTYYYESGYTNSFKCDSFVHEDGNYYYLDNDGVLFTGGWFDYRKEYSYQTYKTVKLYADETGVISSGIKTIDGYDYHFGLPENEYGVPYLLTGNHYTQNEDGTRTNYCSDNEGHVEAIWMLDADGLLTISGKGVIEYENLKFAWLKDRLSIKSIKICDSVNYICDYAFQNCSNLTSITIPNSITGIGGNAFDGCSNLTSITIPDNITSIGKNAFNGCSNLTSITIPDSVTDIGENAFNGCSNLTSITIPDDMTSICNGVFSGCSSLKSFTIPKSISSIGQYAFKDCSSLTNLLIPDTVNDIGKYAFYGCNSISILIPKCNSYAHNWCKNNMNKARYTVQEHQDIQIDPAVEPTISDNGYTEGSHCAACGDVVVEQMEIPALKYENIPGTWVLEKLTSTSLSNPMEFSRNQWYGLFGYYKEMTFYSGNQVQVTSVTNGETNNQTLYYGFDGNTLVLYSYAQQANGKITKEVQYAYVKNQEGQWNGFEGNAVCYYVPQEKATPLITDPQVIGTWKVDRMKTKSGQMKYLEYFIASGLGNWTFTLYNNGIVLVSMSQEQSEIKPYYVKNNCYTFNGTEFYKVSSEFQTNLGDGSTTFFIPLDQPYTLPSTVHVIPTLQDLSVLRLPESLKIIESEAFSNLACQAIIIPDGCTTIGERAFAGCKNLLYVWIPASVTNYPANAFEGCNENLVIDWVKE